MKIWRELNGQENAQIKRRNEIFKFNRVQARDQLTSVNSKTKFLYHMLLIYFYFVLDALIAWTSHTKKVTIATAKVIAKLLLKASLFEDLSTANNILCFNLSKILRESRPQYCYP